MTIGAGRQFLKGTPPGNFYMGVVTSFDPRTGERIMDAEQWKKEAEEWKAMWLCEVYRGDHEFEETYTAAELDRARQTLAGWNKKADKLGNITAEFQS